MVLARVPAIIKMKIINQLKNESLIKIILRYYKLNGNFFAAKFNKIFRHGNMSQRSNSFRIVFFWGTYQECGKCFHLKILNRRIIPHMQAIDEHIIVWSIMYLDSWKGYRSLLKKVGT